MAVRDLPSVLGIALVLTAGSYAMVRAAPKAPVSRPARTPAATRPVVTIRSLDSAPARRMARATRPASPRGMGRRDAFSPAKMESKAKLLRCLREDARFRKNLARHFGVSEGELVDYVDDNVKLFYLKEDLKTDVYAVTRTGRRYRVSQRIPKGVLVFGLPDGYVMMKSNCGNPVVATLPPVPSSAPVAAVAPQPPAPTAVAPPAEAVAGTREELPGVPPATRPMPVGPERQELAALAPVVAGGAPVVVPVESTPGVVQGVRQERRRGGGFPWWLGGLGFLAFAGGDDDDDRRPPVVPPPVVPEPNTAALFVTGGAALVLWNHRKRGR